MTIDTKRLQELLHKHLCQDVKFVSRPYDGALILETKFEFPDGDRYLIHVTNNPTDEDGIRLSDLGHTLMHMSYKQDIDFFLEGARGVLFERIMKETGLKWAGKGGTLCLDTTPEKLSEAVFQFGQALTKIYDMTMLYRFSKISAYYDKHNEEGLRLSQASTDERESVDGCTIKREQDEC